MQRWQPPQVRAEHAWQPSAISNGPLHTHSVERVLRCTAGAANRAVMERGSDTWRKLGQEILSLETNIDYIESMLLPEVEGGLEGEQEGSEGGSQR